MLEFDADISGGEAPINGGLGVIALLLPGIHSLLVFQCGSDCSSILRLSSRKCARNEAVLRVLLAHTFVHYDEYG
jgi:hypothetical protein